MDKIMQEATEVTGTQLITIDPKQYVAAVYAPFRARFDAAKDETDKIESIDATTKDGMQVAVKQRAIFRSIRVDAEKARAQRKAPILEISRLIDGRYKEIESEILAFENTFDVAIKAEENRKELERTAAARAEQARIEAEQAAIKKAEEDRMAAERAELARKQAEIAAAEKAAREKIEAEERAARLRIEEQERAARIQREEADRAARQAREAAEAKARAEREAEDARIKAERDKLEAERRAVEEAQRKEREAAEAKAKAEREAEEAKERAAREAKEAKQREIERQANELKDGRELLSTFVTRFGKRKEFAPVAAAISAFLGAE